MILLLGSKGYLGGCVTRELTHHGIIEVDLDRDNNVIDSNFLDENRVKVILNFANVPGPLNQISEMAISTNLLLPQQLVNACFASHAKPKLIHISTREALGVTYQKNEVTFDEVRRVFLPHFLFNENTVPFPKNLFGSVKLLAEQIVTNYNKGFIVRLATPYTPDLYKDRGGLISRLGYRARCDGKVKLSNNGWQLRDPLHVSDISDFLVRLMESANISSGMFNLGGGKENELSLREIAHVINPDVDIESDVGGDFGFSFDNRKALSCLGWKPKISFKDVDWKISNF